jgi:protein involved in polysaccharide export with SLBB domain
MKLKVLLGFILTFGLFQIVFGQEVMITPEEQRGYLVGPGDEITGRVLGESQFDFVATIDDDGKFQVPFF